MNKTNDIQDTINKILTGLKEKGMAESSIKSEYLGVYNSFGSIIFFVGLTLPRYRFSKPSASLDMNLR